MLVSRCCRSYVILEGHGTHYYACQQCGMAADLIEAKGVKDDCNIKRQSTETVNPA